MFIFGAALGLAAGLRAGTWWTLLRLGEWERKQRRSRVRNWRSGS